MRAIHLLYIACGSASAWIAPQQSRRDVFVYSAHKKQEINLDAPNPCWEDIYDDDCVMSNAASASFVASEWIRKMPCGEGIEDCDMPDGLNVPETRPEAGVEKVDVMAFLGLKRADGIKDREVKP